MQQDVRLLQVSQHFVSVGDEVRRQVATVELHAFNDFELGFQRLGFLDGDNTFVADFLHGFGNVLTDLLVAIGGNGADLCNFFRSRDGLGRSFQRLDSFSSSKIDAALQIHRIHAGSNCFCAFLDDGLSQNSCGCCAVTSDVVGFGSNFTHHLCAHVFELVFQFDFLGNGNTVFGDTRSAEGFVENNVTAFRAEGYLYSVCQGVHAFEHALTGVGGEFYFFSRHVVVSLKLE